MRRTYFIFLLLFPLYIFAQKKPLDHTVYDSWQSIGERMISNDGKWVVYTITPQEGDADLFILATNNSGYKKQVPRGYNAMISDDSRFVVFKIKPTYKETREAKIKKKKLEDFPKDSIGIIELGKNDLIKVSKIKSFKMPEKAGGWLAYQKEKESVTTKAGSPTQKTVDSLKHTIDSLVLLVNQVKNIKGSSTDEMDADEDPSTSVASIEGSDLILRNLSNDRELIFRNVADYYFNNYGQKLLMKIAKSPKDSLSQNAVVLYDLNNGIRDTILKGGNDFRSFAMTEDGNKIAFAAERDTNTKTLQKTYSLYLFKPGYDSAELLIDRKSCGMQLGATVSENGTVSFSKSGNKLFFGTAPIPSLKDTTLVDIDLAKLDIWHYKDDYLQTQQLFQLNNELKRSYLAVYDFGKREMKQLGSKGLPNVIQTEEGDGDIFLAVTDTGRRVEAQWTGKTRKDIYAVDLKTGKNILIKKDFDGQVYPSATGKYILLYDTKARNYSVWNGTELKTITSGIKAPLYNEENDVPDEPSPYGIMGWHQGDSAVYIYDRFDVWKVDPTGSIAPVNLTQGRKDKNSFRYVKINEDEKYIYSGQLLCFKVQNQATKKGGIYIGSDIGGHISIKPLFHIGPYNYAYITKAKKADQYIFTKENYTQSPDLYNLNPAGSEEKLSELNPQQSKYNWGTSELYHWKAFNGKDATGILYKPENFDSTRKYPMLIYFYEKLSDGLYNYIPPAPTPSRLNISFFVSRGYIVLAPDISYTVGHPGKDAYNYVVSGAQSLSKKKWIDANNIGIQGQSWGGYQVAYLVTATKMFKAAWAGAPVVNMFSAYGGIRWESGNNRQSQYEKGQSRIGSTPWLHPELYIENSPLFHLQNITTPLVIMANDADGAVPWYQGIEFFTAMRRLNKKIWLLSYNGEAHNLVERKNRKDIQIREQQYFDWLLKGEKSAKWLTEGVPAVKKGKDWGLEIE
jgi:dipeptidyl aminopeptidase/acylaminoacyl peptidase